MKIKVIRLKSYPLFSQWKDGKNSVAYLNSDIIEIDLSELALKEPDMRGAPLYCLERFIKSKMRSKK